MDLLRSVDFTVTPSTKVVEDETLILMVVSEANSDDTLLRYCKEFDSV